jgi:hypothetical protein
MKRTISARTSFLNPVLSFAGIIVMMAQLSCARPAGYGPQEPRAMKTEVTIVGEQFHINGEPTYRGRKWVTSYGEEYPVEGLLMNARLVQGIFDDLNPATRGQWVYPDTRQWDPDRNTGEYAEAMASWREHGMLAFTLNLQGGCPYGYCNQQPWDNSAFAPDGSLRQDFMNRLERVLNRADDLGMVVILGYFYFGQDGNLTDEAAVIRAVENATNWILEKGYRNVIIEINNECNVRYDDHEILQCHRVHELIQLVRDIELNGRRLYAGTSLGGGSVPPENIVGASDYVLLHGNGVRDPEWMAEMIRRVRLQDVYTPMPVVNNEDDQPWRVEAQGWGDSDNNFAVAVKNYASWGNFDFRLANEHHDYNKGYQSIPAHWHITTGREIDFFEMCARITGYPGTPRLVVEMGGRTGEGTVKVNGARPEVIESVEIIVNNEVVKTLPGKPFYFQLDDLPSGEHWVKARARYMSGDTEVIIASLYHRNPWWPYGGPARGRN